MTRILTLLFLVSALHLTWSQSEIESMLNKSNLIYDENPEESFSLCETAGRKAKETGNHEFDGDISVCKARYYILIAKYDAAGRELNKAIQIFKEKDDLLNLAHAYKLKNILLGRIGNEEEGHRMLLKSLNIYRDLDHNEGIVGALLNLTFDYKNSNEPDSMLICLKELEQRMDDSDPSRFYYYYQNWGMYYQLIEDDKNAIKNYHLALEIAEKEKMTDSKATCLMLLSEAYALSGDLSKADDYAEQSYNFSEENNLIYESYEALTQWIKVKEKLGDIRQAYEIQKKWIRVESEINDLERIQKLQAIESQLELAEKEKQIAEGEIALQKSNLEGQREKTKNAWLVGVIAVVVVLLTFTIFIYARTKKLNNTIKEQKEVVELKSLHLEEALENIEDSLHYSKMIQTSMLPSKAELDAALKSHFILYRPKDIVSGDFYWFHQFEDRTVLAVGDCTGHGVPGAMVSMVCHEALNKIIIEQNIQDPGEILNKVREIVAGTFKRNEHELSDGMDISLIVKKHEEILFAGANNNALLFRNKDAKLPDESEKIRIDKMEQCNLVELRADRQPVGYYFNPVPFVSQSLRLEPGDKIYLFSDGYADQFGGDKGKKLKGSNMRKLIGNSYNLNLPDQGKHLEDVFVEWKGDLEQIDDVAMMGFEFKLKS